MLFESEGTTPLLSQRRAAAGDKIHRDGSSPAGAMAAPTSHSPGQEATDGATTTGMALAAGGGTGQSGPPVTGATARLRRAAWPLEALGANGGRRRRTLSGRAGAARGVRNG